MADQCRDSFDDSASDSKTINEIDTENDNIKITDDSKDARKIQQSTTKSYDLENDKTVLIDEKSKDKQKKSMVTARNVTPWLVPVSF